MFTSFPRIPPNLSRFALNYSCIRQYCYRFRLPIYCLIASIFLHVGSMQLLKMFGRYEFGHAVNQRQALTVDLSSLAEPCAAAGSEAAENPEDSADDQPEVASAAEADDMDAPAAAAKLPLPEHTPETADKTAAAPKVEPATAPPTQQSVAKASAAVEAAVASGKTAAPVVPQAAAVGPQAQPGGQAPAAQYEKLNYALSVGGFMLGVTVGSAELESKNENGVTTITLRVKSSPAFSAIFPVDDEIETQRVDQKYIISKIRQLEGSFQGSEMFTINMGKKRVAWMDMMRSRSQKLNVLDDDVVDTLSGIYSLRNRKLEVGKTEMLHVYDAEVVGDVPVEILRREEMRLPNLTKVKTLVIRPLQKTAGMFRRTGEVLIWMTDDEFKVPVKIVTSMALGKVTAELVSAENKPHDAGGKEIAPGAQAR